VRHSVSSKSPQIRVEPSGTAWANLLRDDAWPGVTVAECHAACVKMTLSQRDGRSQIKNWQKS
jgi:hypothetical protein